MKRLLPCLLLCAGLAGCNVIPPPQADPTHYYVLTGHASAGAATGQAPSGQTGLRVGLRNVDVASYLRGPEMVVRSGGNEIQLRDFARWGETLEAGITRVLHEQLAADPRIATVAGQPFPLSAARDFDVAVTVLHCEGELGGRGGGSAYFQAVIQVSTAGIQPQPVARIVFDAPRMEWNGRDYDALAGLLSADVEELGRRIAAALPASPQP